MAEALFSIHCTTCNRSLSVRAESAIGQILPCPQCGGMVQVVPPPGWSSPESETSVPPAAADTAQRDVQQPLSPSLTWTSPTEAALRKWTLYAGLPVACVVVVWALVSLFFDPGSTGPTTAADSGPVAAEPDSRTSPTLASGPPFPSPEPQAASSTDSSAEDPRSPETSPAADIENTPPVAVPALPELTDDDPPPIEKLPAEQPATDDDAHVAAVKPRPKQAPLSSAVNVEARLADKILGIDEPNITLAALVEMLSGLSTIAMSFDFEAMAELGVHPEDRISVRMNETSIGEILQSALEPVGLTFVVEDQQVLITSRQRQDVLLRTVRYRVSDLTGSSQTAVSQFADLIRRMVRPSTWSDAARAAGIKTDGGSLLITQSEPAQREILLLCEKLRVARKKPIRSGRDPTQFALETRYAAAGEALRQPISANFRRPRPLALIVARLQDEAQVNLSINWLALRQEGISPDVEASVVAQEQPLAEVLDSLLGPLDLIYRIVDSRTMVITSRPAAAEKRFLEFHPVGDLLAGGATPQSLLERIRLHVATDTWKESGGMGDVYLDVPSRCLLVFERQRVHIELEEFLARLRDEAGQ